MASTNCKKTFTLIIVHYCTYITNHAWDQWWLSYSWDIMFTRFSLHYGYWLQNDIDLYQKKVISNNLVYAIRHTYILNIRSKLSFFEISRVLFDLCWRRWPSFFTQNNVILGLNVKHMHIKPIIFPFTFFEREIWIGRFQSKNKIIWDFLAMFRWLETCKIFLKRIFSTKCKLTWHPGSFT